MKITATYSAPARICSCLWHEDCQRFYCRKHRLLYRTCDSARLVSEKASWEDGGTQRWWESLEECPDCIASYEEKKWEKMERTL